MATSPKKALRSEIKSRLSELPAEEITAQSQTAQRLVLESPQYQTALRLSIYLAMPDYEAQTDLLVRDALAANKAVFVPYIHPAPSSEHSSDRSTAKGKRKAMSMLRLQNVADYEALERDSWGIPSLGSQGLETRENAFGGRGVHGEGEESEDGLDLVVVPGVAFDGTMGRLGHGAGFYDRLLTKYGAASRRKKPFLVGLCLAEQLLASGEVPTDPWDHTMDAVAVGDGKLVTSDS